MIRQYPSGEPLDQVGRSASTLNTAPAQKALEDEIKTDEDGHAEDHQDKSHCHFDALYR